MGQAKPDPKGQDRETSEKAKGITCRIESKSVNGDQETRRKSGRKGSANSMGNELHAPDKLPTAQGRLQRRDRIPSSATRRSTREDQSSAPRSTAINHVLNGDVVHVKAGTLNPILGCALCGNYMEEPVTIVECMHSLCRYAMAITHTGRLWEACHYVRFWCCYVCFNSFEWWLSLGDAYLHILIQVIVITLKRRTRPRRMQSNQPERHGRPSNNLKANLIGGTRRTE